MAFVKFSRVSTTDKFEPNFEAWERRELTAPSRFVSVASMFASDAKSPVLTADRPRPALSNDTPEMVSVLVESSLKVTFRSSPPSRFLPLNPASAVSWSI